MDPDIDPGDLGSNLAHRVGANPRLGKRLRRSRCSHTQPKWAESLQDLQCLRDAGPFDGAELASEAGLRPRRNRRPSSSKRGTF